MGGSIVTCNVSSAATRTSTDLGGSGAPVEAEVEAALHPIELQLTTSATNGVSSAPIWFTNLISVLFASSVPAGSGRIKEIDGCVLNLGQFEGLTSSEDASVDTPPFDAKSANVAIGKVSDT
jgi:hypothetical protein